MHLQSYIMCYFITRCILSITIFVLIHLHRKREAKVKQLVSRAFSTSLNEIFENSFKLSISVFIKGVSIPMRVDWLKWL